MKFPDKGAYIHRHSTPLASLLEAAPLPFPLWHISLKLWAKATNTRKEKKIKIWELIREWAIAWYEICGGNANLRRMCTCMKREMREVSLQKEMNKKGEVARLEREGSFPTRENWDSSSFETKMEEWLATSKRAWSEDERRYAIAICCLSKAGFWLKGFKAYSYTQSRKRGLRLSYLYCEFIT